MADRGFFGKRLVSQAGVPVLSHACVADEALQEASQRISRQLSRARELRENMVKLGCEIHVIGKDQGCSALPEYRHLGPDEAKVELKAPAKAHTAVRLSLRSRHSLQQKTTNWSLCGVDHSPHAGLALAVSSDS